MNLKEVFAKGIALCAILACGSQASMISTPEYGVASHGNTKWQSLGVEKYNVAATNNGVTWSIDNGVTFSDDIFEFEAGTDIIFKFEVYKQYWGVHSFDGLTAWIDDDNDNVYGEDDLFVKDQWNFNYDDPSIEGIQNYYKDPAWGIPFDQFYADSSTFFTQTYSFDTEGEYNLRARVTCSSDLSGIGYNPYPGFSESSWNLAPIGYKYQGEVEDYKFQVTNVPEPTFLALFGIGLFSLFFARRKNQK